MPIHLKDSGCSYTLKVDLANDIASSSTPDIDMQDFTHTPYLRKCTFHAFSQNSREQTPCGLLHLSETTFKDFAQLQLRNMQHQTSGAGTNTSRTIETRGRGVSVHGPKPGPTRPILTNHPPSDCQHKCMGGISTK